MKRFLNWDFAHRGLHSKSARLPENSMAAFRAAVDNGYGAELDVHLLKDGRLAVIHDSSLLRTAGSNEIIEQLTEYDLKNFLLEGTSEQIPLLEDVLALFKGRAPLIIELKTYGNNSAALCEAVCKILDNYTGDFCVESFDPRCLRWFKKRRPKIIRGQLAQNFLKNPSGMGRIVDFFLTSLFLNIITRPHFIAYKYEDMGNLPYKFWTKLLNRQGVAWTINSIENYNKAKSENLIVIFEGFNANSQNTSNEQ